jgi:thymidylate synthase (FAD)
VNAQVRLLSHTPDPEGVVARATKLCYSSLGIEDLQRTLDGKDRDRLLAKVISMGHHSVLEHASFTFGVEGASRVMTHQLVRHRLASYSQQSQRYVQLADSLPVVIPESIRGEDGAAEKFREHCKRSFELYREMCDEGIPAEDARYLLPSATKTNIIVTMNGSELRHFFRLRCCESAQWEIRDVAEKMMGIVKPLAPAIFADAGPSCLTGPCPEGEMTCGKIKEVRAKYKEMSFGSDP